MGVSLVGTSPYVYAAICCFFLSTASSDLLVIRLALTHAYFLMVLAAWSGYSSDGSFSSETVPFADGSIDLALIFYTILCIWNAGACFCLLDDLRPRKKLPLLDQTLYNFFRRRCGVTRVEFDEIRRQGHFLELGADEQVPNTDSTLYLVLEGLVECETKGRHPRRVATMFPKRSGQFFDLKHLNIFSLPVGFDSLHFKATTATKTKLFAWPMNSLIAMRDSQSPCLRPFWEFMVLRSLARDSIRHHLQEADETGSWPLPESPEWWDGGPSYDFEEPGTIDKYARPSKFHLLPPQGIRNPAPCIHLQRQGQQNCIEIVAKAKQDCMDRMEGEEGSWQNVLFMSTFGCFKESSSEVDMSTPAKSTPARTPARTPANRRSNAASRMEQPTNPIAVNSTMLPQLGQSAATIQRGHSYESVPHEDDTTPKVSNHYVANSVQMWAHPVQARHQPYHHHYPTDDQSYASLQFSTNGTVNSTVKSDLVEETKSEIQPIEQQSTFVTATSSSRSDLEEAKTEIQPESCSEPLFDTIWNNSSDETGKGSI